MRPVQAVGLGFRGLRRGLMSGSLTITRGRLGGGITEEDIRIISRNINNRLQGGYSRIMARYHRMRATIFIIKEESLYRLKVKQNNIRSKKDLFHLGTNNSNLISFQI